MPRRRVRAESVHEGVVRMREEAELTQIQLAVAAGLSPSTVARIESGDQENPRIQTLAAIAKACGCTMRVTFRTITGE